MATNLGPKGLHTFANELQYPEGALSEAENVVIDKEGVAEPRRGFTQYGEPFGSGQTVAKSILVYKGRTIVHHGDTVEFDTDGEGVYQPFNGTYLEPESGIRIKSQEANGNLYFTTRSGIQKISATGVDQINENSIILAGAPQAINLTGTIDYAGIPWFLPESKVAYQVVWGYKDNNSNLILGAPSPKYELINRSTSETAGVNLDISIPNDVVQGVHFYQIYRSATAQRIGAFSLDDTNYPEEYNLIYESFPTEDEIASRVIHYKDITGDDIRKTGTYLYTNENTGGGALQANHRPPKSTDLTLFSGSVFYSNTSLPHFMNSTLLGVTNFTPNASDFIVSDGETTNKYTFVGEREVSKLTLFRRTDDSNLFDPSWFYGQGFLIYSPENVLSYVVYFTDGTPEAEPDFGYPDGSILIQVDIHEATDFSEIIDAIVESTEQDPNFSRDFVLRTNADEPAEIATNEIEFLGIDNGFAIDAIDMIGKKYITNATNTANTVLTVPKHGYANGTVIVITDTGEPLLDNKTFIVSKIDNDKIDIMADLSSLDAPLTRGRTRRINEIVNITSGTTPQIETSDIHLLQPGNVVTFMDTGLVELDNQSIPVNTVVDTTNFTVALLDPVTTSNQGFLFESDYLVTTNNGRGEDAANNEVKIGNTLSVAQSIRITANSLTNVINQNPNSMVNAYYVSTADSLPGQMDFHSKTQEDKPFYLATSDPSIASSFNPNLPVAKVASSIASSTTIITMLNHGFVTGDNIVIYDAQELNGLHRITKIDDNSFSIEKESTIGDVFQVFKPIVSSENERIPNRLYFSKYQQPEAVPRLNYLDIGTRDKPIERILPLRDSLIVFKEDGIFRVFGNIAPNFQVVLFDTSAKLLAPDSAAVLNNRIYCLTTQGIVEVTDSGVNIRSRPIEDKLAFLPQAPAVRFNSFAITSETDRAYMLWTMERATDTTPTVCYRFNVFTNAWTEWPIIKTCGALNPVDDKIYLGAADINQVEVERKTRTRKDYADRQYELNIPGLGVNGTEIEVSNATRIVPGDVIEQTQYITVAGFNRLLTKLDMDPGIPSNDYLSSLELKPGDYLFQRMVDLINKLQSEDPLAPYPTPISSDFQHLQEIYNLVVDALNHVDSVSFYKNYKYSLGEYKIEGIVISRKLSTNKLNTRFSKPFLEGPIIHYTAIKTKVTWIPQHFGDPYTLKQVAEGTFIFKFNNFTSGHVSYNSDIEQDFDGHDFMAFGPGAYGGFDNGGHTFGGQGNKVPVRTYIPRTKQRCRFLQCRFTHDNAFEYYELYGVTFNPRPYSTRGYR